MHGLSGSGAVVAVLQMLMSFVSITQADVRSTLPLRQQNPCARFRMRQALHRQFGCQQGTAPPRVGSAKPIAG